MQARDLLFQASIPAWEIATRLGFAVAFGMVLGLDRELQGKAAGLRTHMLIALGAATTTLIGIELYMMALAIGGDNRSDLLRVIEGVIAAIGFLGAGAIISGTDRRVHNMTTAANIWICGIIGLACGAGHYVLASIAFGFTVVILVLLRIVEKIFRYGES